jgi:polyphosphate:AMP phosphotransferase
MLEQIDLKSKMPKGEFKRRSDELAVELGKLQRQSREAGIPILIVFEGWGGGGKGTLINKLIQCLDPRGFKVHSVRPPNEDEALHPFLWRFWVRTPAAGRIAVFDQSWYQPVLRGGKGGPPKEGRLLSLFEDIASFERHLADGGTLILKFFVHISQAEQKKRFKKLDAEKATAWRVPVEDWEENRHYREHFDAANRMLSRTDRGHAPWTIVAGHDERWAVASVLGTVAQALAARLDREGRQAGDSPPEASVSVPASPDAAGSPLATVDLSASIDRDEYEKRLEEAQGRLRLLEHEIYMRRIPVIVLYEGWDAAGKGGNIRRLTRKLDPRGYEVIPVGAPNDVERAHHYLWRFWNALPKAGHMAIFDRSWYGRVLVERVEGFCTEAEWSRAYGEINDFERQVANFGTVIVKFWLHIDGDEQLRRFEARQTTEHKQWKITEEDWRNRERWGDYREAVEEMLLRTSTPSAPWNVIAANSKRHARVACIEAVVRAIEAAAS